MIFNVSFAVFKFHGAVSLSVKGLCSVVFLHFLAVV